MGLVLLIVEWLSCFRGNNLGVALVVMTSTLGGSQIGITTALLIVADYIP